MSVKACVNAALELIEFCNNKNLPIGFSTESITIRKEEIEASVELLNQVKISLETNFIKTDYNYLEQPHIAS